MSDFLDDDYLLSEDYKKKDDDLEDDLDEAALLYSSDEADGSLLQDEDEDADLQTGYSVSNQSSHIDEHNSETKPEPIVITRLASEVADSDSEGTDTKDENDDGPIDYDNSTQGNVTVYRTISNVTDLFIDNTNDVSTTQEDNSVLGDDNITTQIENEDAGIDEDEESDDDERDKRNRFRSERDGRMTVSSKRPSTDKRAIPDTLEISEEEQQRIENFDKQQKEKRFNKRNRGRGRGNKKGFLSQPRFQFRGIQRGGLLQNMTRQRYPTLKFPPFRPFLRTGTSATQPPLTIFSRPPSSSSNMPPSMVQGMSLQLRMMQPPPFFPGMPPPPLPVSSSIPPPQLPVNQQFQTLPPFQRPPPALVTSQPQAPASSIPVIAAMNRKPDSDAASVSDNQNKGNPIPTLLSGPTRAEPVGKPIKTIDSKIDREVVYDDMQRSSQLSVKIARSRSRSRSTSPIPQSRKRTVLRPRKSRSPVSRHRRRAKSPPPKKRSRKRSRSYSPRRRSPPPAHRNSSENTSSAPRSGKILINPHFKGTRKLPASAAVVKKPEVSETKTTATTSSLSVLTSVAPPFMSVPPPPLPSRVGVLPLPPNVLIPPPPIPNVLTPPQASTACTAIPPPVPIRPPHSNPSVSLLGNPPLQTSSVQMRPMIPPSAQIFSIHSSSVQNLHPPPRIEMMPFPGPPPTAAGSLNNNHLPRPRMFLPNKRPRAPYQNSQIRNTSFRQNDPVVHIRSVYSNTQPPNSQKRQTNSSLLTSSVRNAKPSLPTNRIQRQGITPNLRMESRLKPPPASDRSSQIFKNKVWQDNYGTNDDYQAKVKQQAEKRKQYLETKARKRFRGGDNTSTKTAKIAQIQPAYTPYKPPGPSSVKISNLASATNIQSIEKLMSSVGPVDNVEYKKEEKAIVGKFKSSEHAKLFADKYNRHLLDLSCISISLVV